MDAFLVRLIAVTRFFFQQTRAGSSLVRLGNVMGALRIKNAPYRADQIDFYEQSILEEILR